MDGVGTSVGRAVSISVLVAVLASVTGGQNSTPVEKQITPCLAQEAYLKASNTDPTDLLGGSIAMWGDTLVIGASRESSRATGANGDQSDNSEEASGAVYVFVRGQNGWTQQAYLKASNTGEFDSFGSRVAIHEDTLVVGAPGESSAALGTNGDQSDNTASSAGAAYVFVRENGVWSQQAYLKASNTGVNDRFGLAVAVTGDWVAVGSRMEDSDSVGIDGPGTNDRALESGAVYLYKRVGTMWSHDAYIKSSNSEAGDGFGRSIAAWGGRFVVGAPFEDSAATGVDGTQSDNSSECSGAAYVFARVAGSWLQESYLKSSSAARNQEFGRVVGFSGETIVVGTRVDGAYVFADPGTGWQLEQHLLPQVTDLFDEVGFSVAIAGDVIAVGAPLEDGGATGVNGDDLDNDFHSAGAAYVFVRSGERWEEAAYLKSSNTSIDQFFGVTLTTTEAAVVVCATGEDSGATGVNGDQSDTSALSSGAAYAFRLPAMEDEAFCFGDSSGAPCPCFNFGQTGAGCQNSTAQGAVLSASGIACPDIDLLSLTVQGSVPGGAGLLFQGSVGLGLGQPLGDGLLCLTPRRRWEVRTADAAGTVAYGPRLLGSSPAASSGSTVDYQWWYRDAASPCGNGFNFSNGLRVAWQ